MCIRDRSSAEEVAAEWANKQREKLQKRVTKSSWWMRIKKFFSDFRKSMKKGRISPWRFVYLFTGFFIAIFVKRLWSDLRLHSLKLSLLPISLTVFTAMDALSMIAKVGTKKGK